MSWILLCTIFILCLLGSVNSMELMKKGSVGYKVICTAFDTDTTTLYIVSYNGYLSKVSSNLIVTSDQAISSNYRTMVTRMNACHFLDGKIYMVGNGVIATITSTASSVAADNTQFLDYNFIRTFPSSSTGCCGYMNAKPYFAITNASTIFRIDQSDESSTRLAIYEFNSRPLSGFSRLNFVYVWTEAMFYRLADTAAFGYSHSFPFEYPIVAGTARATTSTGSTGYFIAFPNTCILGIGTINFVSFFQQWNIPTLGQAPPICNATSIMVDDSSVYVVSDSGIYKISHVSFVLTDYVEISTKLSSNVAMTQSRRIALDYNNQTDSLVSISTYTCTGNTYISQGQCVQCSGTGVPSLPYSSTSCSSCPAGYYLINRQCIECSDGTYGGSPSCLTCPAGSYTNATTGHARCLSCPWGQRSNGTNCAPCPAGNVLSNNMCRNCTDNTYAPNPGATFCLACPANYYSNATTGTTQCVQCVGNFAVTAYGQKCMPCSRGTVATPANPTCTACNPGTYESNNRCLPCPDNTYNPSRGSINCIPCARDYYSNVTTGFVNCQYCAGTMITPSPSERICNACPAGQTVSNGQCTPCSPGWASPMPTIPCTRCSENYYAPQSGMSTCLACPTNTYTNSTTGFVSCTQCVGNFTYVNFFTGLKCLACNRGYVTTPSNHQCTPCPPGNYGLNNNCVRCADNTFSSQPGSPTCQSCANGFYSNSTTGFTSCTFCSGFFTFGPSGRICVSSCNPGSVIANGQCQQCGAGTFASGSSCVRCPDNQYAPSPGATSCATCPGGSYTNTTTGFTNCRVCNGNLVTNQFGQRTCTDCPRGSIITSAGVCMPCPWGTQVNGKECISCSPGTYSIGGAMECTECFAGFFSNETSGFRNCYICPSQTYSGVKAERCEPCESGHVSSEHASSCTPCAAGTYQISGTCSSCINNTFSTAASVSCTECPEDHFSSETKGECLSCSTDHWNKSGYCKKIGPVAMGITIPVILVVAAAGGFFAWTRLRKISDVKKFRRLQYDNEMSSVNKRKRRGERKEEQEDVFKLEDEREQE